MTPVRKTYIVGAGAILIVIVGIAYSVDRRDTSLIQTVGSGDTHSTSSPPVVELYGIEGATITPIPLDTSTHDLYPAPSLERAYLIPTRYPEEYRTGLRAKIELVIGALQKDPTITNEWLNLAIYRKQIEDFEGARDIWEYLKRASPDNSVPYSNLADLYHFYIKDYPKSEQNFRAAIARDPANPALYQGLHELYRYSYKTETSLAVDVLREGISRVSSPLELQLLLGRYYEDKGDSVNARKYLTEARDSANAAGRADVAAQIEVEIQGIK